MAKWLIEQGIGETRALLVDAGKPLAARLWRESFAPHAGEVRDAVLASVTPLQAQLADGTLVDLTKKPQHISEGETLRIRIRRSPIVERSGQHYRLKPAKAVPVDSDTPLLENDPLALLADDQHPAELVSLAPPPAPDILMDHGWDDLIEQASSGVIAFPDGELVITPTPAMTVIDIDGSGATVSMCQNAARIVAIAAQLFDIGGMIAVDFPTLERREDRQKIAEAFDAAMLGPFERTAINGFGLMQIVRKRTGPSLIELCQLRPIETALLRLLRQAERWDQPGDITLTVDASGAKLLNDNAIWLEQLQRRTGRNVTLQTNARDHQSYHITRLEPVAAKP